MCSAAYFVGDCGPQPCSSPLRKPFFEPAERLRFGVNTAVNPPPALSRNKADSTDYQHRKDDIGFMLDNT